MVFFIETIVKQKAKDVRRSRYHEMKDHIVKFLTKVVF